MRKRLNKTVRALHEIREPLGKTPFEMQGQLARIQGVPDVPLDVPHIGTLTHDEYQTILGMAERVARMPKEFQEHLTSRWRGLKEHNQSLQLAQQIRDEMKIMTEAVDLLSDKAVEPAENLGFQVPQNLIQIQNLIDLANHLATASGIPKNWTNSDSTESLEHLAWEQRDNATRRTDCKKQLRDAFGDPTPSFDYLGYLTWLSLSDDEKSSLGRLYGEEYPSVIVRQPEELVNRCVESERNLQEIIAQTGELIGIFGSLKWTPSSGQR